MSEESSKRGGDDVEEKRIVKKPRVASCIPAILEFVGDNPTHVGEPRLGPCIDTVLALVGDNPPYKVCRYALTAACNYVKRNARHWKVRDGNIIMEVKGVDNLPYHYFPTFVQQIYGIRGRNITIETVYDAVEWHCFMETRGIEVCDDLINYDMLECWVNMSAFYSAEKMASLLDRFFKNAYCGLVHNLEETTKEFIKIADQLDEPRNMRTVASAFSVEQWKILFDMGTRNVKLGEVLVRKLEKWNGSVMDEVTIRTLEDPYLAQMTFSQVQDRVLVMVIDFLQGEHRSPTDKRVGPYLRYLREPVQLVKLDIYDFGTFLWSKGPSLEEGEVAEGGDGEVL